MKKLMPVTVLFCLLAVLLTGCSGHLLDGEYSNIKWHEAGNENYETQKNFVGEAKNADEVRALLFQMLENHSEFGTIKLANYEGDMTVDVVNACASISYDTAIGKYAVYYIGSNITQIMSYYNAEITVSYKKTLEEINRLSTADSDEEIYDIVKACMTDGTTDAAFYTKKSGVDNAMISDMALRAHFEDPKLAVVVPEITVTEYEGSETNIVSLEVKDNYSATTKNVMRLSMADNASKMINAVKDMTTAEAACELSRMIREQTLLFMSFDSAYNRNDSLYTAYGALVGKRANSEGIALAMKYMCNELGMNCTVVLGKLGGSKHCWNIIEIGGEYYHFDVSAAYSSGWDECVLKNDLNMGAEYWWDITKYPVCSGNLTYSGIF